MMPQLMVRASAMMLQAVATLPDTIVTRQITVVGWFDQVTHVATGILILLLLALVLRVFPAAWQMRIRLNQIRASLDGLRHDFGPLIERTRGVMQNAEQISVTLRDDVERMSEVVERFEAQLIEIADITGARVRDFDALLGAVQEEAEDLFLTTASAARGLRAGVRVLRGHRARKARRDAVEAARAHGADLEDEDADAAAEVDAPDDPEPRERAPRLRRRRRGVT